MEGPRDKTTNLWTIPIRQSSPPEQQAASEGVSVVTTTSKYNNKTSVRIVPHSANSAYTQRSAVELQAWHHGTLGSPPVATLIDAIKND